MKNIKTFDSFLNESTASTPESNIFIGSSVGGGFNKSKPLDTIKKIRGVKETKLKDGTSQITYTDPNTKVDTWVFYNNGRAFNLQTKGMYSYSYNPSGFIEFKKDPNNPNSGAPAKVGDFLVIGSSNPYDLKLMASGYVTSVEKNSTGFWEIRVKANYTEDGKEWKEGTIVLDSQNDKFTGSSVDVDFLKTRKF
jgi:hypothetical protein